MSLDTTRLNNFVNTYADPGVSCTLRHVECDGRCFVVIDVQPFAFAPHITTKDYPGTLSRATLYVRTANNASAPISDSIEFNAVVERAIKIRRGEMLNAVLIILPELEDAITSRSGDVPSDQQKAAVLRRAERAAPVLRGAEVLWVDDHPENNLYERRILRNLGIFVDLARSTDEAIAMLRQQRYDMVISDMERDGVWDEGMRLVRDTRALHLDRPTVFYTGAFDASCGVPPYAFGMTDRPDQLLHYVMDVLERVHE